MPAAMARLRPLMLLPPLVAAGFVGLAYVGMQRKDPDALPSAVVGSAAPLVSVEPLAGKPIFDAATLQTPGVKLVNFWASWCPPCRAEAPVLEGLAAEGVAIYGVNFKDKPENALAFLAELGDPYRAIGADASGRMGIDWGVYGMPETFVIDGAGKVITRFAGPITERSLEDTIRPAMAEAAR